MDKNFIAKAEISVDAPKTRVWQALTQPDMIAKYLFGTRVESEWKVGGPIRYRGEWKGKAYEDKGVILEMEPPDRLVSTYWSSMGGTPDLPGNYKTVSYDLSEDGSGTRLTLVQDNNKSEEEARHAEGNWRAVLGKLKEVLEEESLASSVGGMDEIRE